MGAQSSMKSKVYPLRSGATITESPMEKSTPYFKVQSTAESSEGAETLMCFEIESTNGPPVHPWDKERFNLRVAGTNDKRSST